MKSLSKILAGVLVLALGAGLIGCNEPQAQALSEKTGLLKFSSYQELYSYLKETANDEQRYLFGSFAADTAVNSALLESTEESKEYSQTNTQVEGIDEGDIVKTDGEYIYILRGDDISIVKAQGAESAEVARINVAKDDEKGQSWEYVQEFYVADGLLSVIKFKNQYLPANDLQASSDVAVNRIMPLKNVTYVSIYDVSDKENITLKAELGQDGYFVSSRLKDGKLYLLSSYANGQSWKEDDILSYVPCLYNGTKTEAVAIDDISLLPKKEGVEYTVINEIDIEKGKISSTQGILGGYATVYMNENNLYLAYDHYNVEKEEKTIEGRKVEEYTNTTETDIVRISLGEMETAAFGSIDGYLLNQFALDEYEGNLRIAATVDKYVYQTSEDQVKGYSNYETIEDTNANCLYVLDDDLKIIGTISDLAPDEQIYSVRFDGEVGYFVTFRQVDPLFSVDLSNPAAPKIMGELKIPGFSQYLHVYGEDLLFGLGMTADEKTGRTGSLKLSMFDVSNPYDVTEKHQLVLEENYSTALYNHKAILVAKEKDLIAFPVDKGYKVFGYDEMTGFINVGEIETDNWCGDSRGVYIDDYFYVCNYDQIYILDMNNFALAKELTIGKDADNYGRLMIN